jgi:hypothetical protein
MKQPGAREDELEEELRQEEEEQLRREEAVLNRRGCYRCGGRR